MTLSVIVKDGKGTKNFLQIEEGGTAQVVVHPHPPENEHVLLLPFSQSLTDDGTATGSADMQVVGTLAAPIEFRVKASDTKDIYIKTLSIEIADSGASLNEFGAVTALTNGCKLLWRVTEVGEIQIDGALKSNYDFVRLAQGNPSFGTGNASFLASNVEGTSEAFIPVIDFAAVFGLPWGLRLRKGSTDSLVLVVQDTTTAVDAFNMIAYGVQR